MFKMKGSIFPKDRTLSSGRKDWEVSSLSSGARGHSRHSKHSRRKA